MYDYILIGHGLAGISLAEHLITNGKKILVLDAEKKHSSSLVAAGLYNPITGRVMKKTWKADELFPYLTSFYQRLEQKIEGHFFHDRSIYRPFFSLEEQNEWYAKGKDEPYQDFIQEIHTKPIHEDFLHNPYGGLLLKNAGFVDIPALKEAHKAYLNTIQAYQKKQISEADIIINKQSIKVGNHETKALIFCDGPLSEFSFFNYLPTAPVKGELIHIKPKADLPEQMIFNRGVFILKSPNSNCYRVGATYEWKNLTNEPTAKAREQLIDKLEKLIHTEYEIVEQVAGVRPATKDRKPFIGTHPMYKNIHIFNGLGTKGVSLAPYFANNFAQHLIDGTSLIDEVNISRFYSLY